MGQNTKRVSNLQESTVAAFLGWKRVKGSGARPLHPGDIISDRWLGECKTHTSPGHKLIFSFDVWDKLEAEAISQFKRPVLFVDDGSQKVAYTWAMVKNEELDVKSVKAELLDCSKNKSIRINTETDQAATMFLRKNEVYIVMSLKAFKEFAGCES